MDVGPKVDNIWQYEVQMCETSRTYAYIEGVTGTWPEARKDINQSGTLPGDSAVL